MYYLNGKIENKKLNNKGFFYGYGCFETVMGLKNTLIFFEEHIVRLENSLKYLDIYREIDYKSIVQNLIESYNLKDEKEFFVKIIVTDIDVYINIEKIKLREENKGIKISKINNFYQNELGFLKSLNYLNNILARKQLSENKLYEGIFINRNNFITEGTISNIFFIKDNIIKTPSLDLNILNGIVREKIINIARLNNIVVEEGNYNYEDLINSDAIFITNSLMKNGLLWVNELENKILKTKHTYVSLLEKEYLKLIEIMV